MIKTLLYFFLFAFLTPFLTIAQDGTPDLSFGNGGTIQADISGGAADWALSITEQNDGKLLVVGSIDVGNFEFDATIVRFNSDGSIDTPFGTNGVVTKDFGGDLESYTYVGAQSDGNIIVGGSVGPFGNKIVTLSRYLSNGDLDTSFGTNGDLVPFNSLNESSAFALLDDDSFLIANPVSTGGERIRLNRYLPDGTLDTSFGDNGTALVDNGELSNSVYFIKVMGDGRIMVGGRMQSNGVYQPTLVRLLPSGEKDTSFGGNGAALLTEFSNYTLKDIALYDDGRIAVLQNLYTSNPDTFHNRITRYHADGTYDPTYGPGGQGFIDPDINVLSAQSLLMQPNQRLLLYGEYTDFFEGGGNTFLKRYFHNGGTDDSFNITTVLNSEYFAGNLLLQNDGKLVCMGISAWYNGDEDFVLERYNNNPLNVPEFEVGNLTAYPNPTQDIVTIASDNFLISEGPYQISDITGKILLHGNLRGSRTEINLSCLRSGLYFLKAGNTLLRLIKK